MTTPTRLERTLPGILDDLSAGPTPEYLDDVLARTGRMRQRPGWTFPERWLPMADITRSRAFAPAPPWRLIALALVVIALVAGALLYAGSRQQRVPPPFGPAKNGLIDYEVNGDIYVGDPVTGDSRLIVGGSETDSAPGFSPDGALVAFLRLDTAQCCMNSHLVVVRPDGSDLNRVTTTSFASDTWVNWTPDSRHFAVIAASGGQDEIDILDLSGNVQRLATGMAVASLTFRPPLAQEILFRGVQDGHPGLYAMATDGTNIRPLITTAEDNDLDLANAVYSVDGTRIFFQKAVQVTPDNGCCQLWVMNADGSNAHRFVSDADAAWEGVPSVSQDGRWVAFWRALGGTGTIAVVRADGTGPVIQTRPVLRGLAGWNWAPDSSTIVMRPDDAADGAPSIYLLDPAGGRETTTALQTNNLPDWQRLAR